ncbi:ECF transporter S component [Clostridium sp. MB40-C1]|uniref:ECF transporter S component n=1 Tax=Clostridium sp. MB40-C1 TaxID=3070996 RepID=UPI0027DFAD3B|nr:ECF transporter S component [Clostridium sp. MB40-C1]WMJ80301.1 ECF transporter S component [Clostridium sp. MB40-C1]
MERNFDVNSKRKAGTRKITTLAMLSAIAVLLGFTPLGIIPIPPVAATIMHIPVIIAAVLEGPVIGAVMGLIFGILSIIRAVTTGNILLVAILNPLVSVAPRILIGILTYYAYKLIPTKKESVRIGVAAAVGTLTNTFGFLGMMYLLYAEPFAKANNMPIDGVGKAIAVIGITHGIPEIIVAIIITVGVVLAVKKVRKN